MGIFDKIREGLRKTRDNISGQITQMVNSFTKIDEELFEELEELLVMGDVGVNTAGFICDRLRQRIKEKGITDPSLIMGELKAIVSDMLQGPGLRNTRQLLFRDMRRKGAAHPGV